VCPYHAINFFRVEIQATTDATQNPDLKRTSVRRELPTYDNVTYAMHVVQRRRVQTVVRLSVRLVFPDFNSVIVLFTEILTRIGSHSNVLEQRTRRNIVERPLDIIGVRSTRRRCIRVFDDRFFYNRKTRIARVARVTFESRLPPFIIHVNIHRILKRTILQHIYIIELYILYFILFLCMTT